jgi:cytochrome c oxidase subunit 2
MKLLRSCFILLNFVLLASCSRNPSILLEPAGPSAKETGHLFWFFFSVNSIVFTLIIIFLFFSLWRRSEPDLIEPFHPTDHAEKKLIVAVGICVGLTALILTIFVGASYLVDRNLIQLDRHPTVNIEITAHQWWWEVRYLSHNPEDVFTTANEIHVPIHERVRFILKSSDVIHSLWFPNLSGKKDIIPGRDQDLFIRVDKVGKWLGRCGEFCGLQHAFMGLTLFAETRKAFDDWKVRQRSPAMEPQLTEEKRGREIFKGKACVACHSIRENDSTGYSNNAPDLTHLKSRTTIGAGAAENTKGYLGGWIIDPHGIKPGVHMPTILEEPKDFQALLSYLEILK